MPRSEALLEFIFTLPQQVQDSWGINVPCCKMVQFLPVEQEDVWGLIERVFFWQICKAMEIVFTGCFQFVFADALKHTRAKAITAVKLWWVVSVFCLNKQVNFYSSQRTTVLENNASGYFISCHTCQLLTLCPVQIVQWLFKKWDLIHFPRHDMSFLWGILYLWHFN